MPAQARQDGRDRLAGNQARVTRDLSKAGVACCVVAAAWAILWVSIAIHNRQPAVPITLAEVRLPVLGVAADAVQGEYVTVHETRDGVTRIVVAGPAPGVFDVIATAAKATPQGGLWMASAMAYLSHADNHMGDTAEYDVWQGTAVRLAVNRQTGVWTFTVQAVE